LERFLKATYFVDCDHPLIRDKAVTVTRGLAKDREKAVALFDFVRDRITYNPYGPVEEEIRYKASRTLQRGYGFCIQKATLLAAMLRSVSIPAALVFADIINPLVPENLKNTLGTDRFLYHCYNDICIDGGWLKATCAFDAVMCVRIGVPVVQFDGTKDAVFPAFLPDGRQFVTYYNHRGIYDDVPFQDIINGFRAFYGEEVLKAAAEHVS
jgi:transglutaminase-like putative cysteine protease